MTDEVPESDGASALDAAILADAELADAACAPSDEPAPSQGCVDVDECANPELCPSPQYPCVQTAPPGYTCRGQFADWPMPDGSGASLKPSYLVAMPGVVHDDRTKLSWQSELPSTYDGCSEVDAGQGGLCTFEQANTYCEQLELAGKQDWRLPTRIELISILELTTAADPGLINVAFTSRHAARFWSSSRVTGPGAGWSVDFARGDITPQVLDAHLRARCVRSSEIASGTPATRYRELPDSILDTRTGLAWAKAVSEGTFNWQGARDFCAAQGNDFRVPTIKELQTIVDPLKTSNLTPKEIPANGETVWSASTDVKTDGHAWATSFRLGSSASFVKEEGQGVVRVRCVRSVKP